jgi:hypothetical protein
MLSEVEQDVNKGVAELTRGSEGPGMIAAAPDVTVATPGAVEGARGAPGQALETATEALARRCFHDEMKVIGLGGKMDHAKVPTVRAVKRGAHGQEGQLGPQ